jgi:hypothetical protein
MAPHDAQGIPRPESAPRTCAAAPRGRSLITSLLQKLEREQYDRREHVGPYVDGWTDRGDSLVSWLRIEIGLAELRACDVEIGGEA